MIYYHIKVHWVMCVETYLVGVASSGGGLGLGGTFSLLWRHCC